MKPRRGNGGGFMGDGSSLVRTCRGKKRITGTTFSTPGGKRRRAHLRGGKTGHQSSDKKLFEVGVKEKGKPGERKFRRATRRTVSGHNRGEGGNVNRRYEVAV